MSRSRNTPYKGQGKWGEYDTPGQWAGIKDLRREKNRQTRHRFKNQARSVKDFEELDDMPAFEDFRPRSQAKWAY